MESGESDLRRDFRQLFRERDGHGATEPGVSTASLAPRFFAVFGMRPLVGRAFVDEEEQTNGPGAAVISERFWTRRFGRDPSAVGRALLIGGRSYEIVGVMPGAFTPGAFASATTDVWLPAQFSAFMMRQRNARFLTGVGRLRQGVTVEAGARDLTGVQAELGREFPETDAGWSSETRPMKDAVSALQGARARPRAVLTSGDRRRETSPG
jgi:hypothetical protein